MSIEIYRIDPAEIQQISLGRLGHLPRGLSHGVLFNSNRTDTADQSDRDQRPSRKPHAPPLFAAFKAIPG